jgi:agmatine/peptidylarginine deiminase
LLINLFIEAMIRIILSVTLFLLPVITVTAQNQNPFSRKPDLKKISAKAIENFKKAKAEGKTKSIGDSIPNLARNTNTVLDYNLIPADARVPGQFEESQAVAMTWQYGYNANGTIGEPASDATPYSFGKIACELAAAIQQSAKVIIRVHTAQDSTTVKNIMIARGTPLTNYSFYVHPVDSFWDRDSGPISFYYGNQDNIGMIDMDYYTYEAIVDENGSILTDFVAINEGGRLNDDLIPVAISEKLVYQLYKTPLNDEGGNIISDGLWRFIGSDGTRLNNTTVIGAESNYSIYPNYPIPTQTEFNNLFLNSFKINNHIETEKFSCDGGTGHIDLFGKLIDENNFILADYTQAINHTDFVQWNNNLTQLQSLTDSNGKPITIKLVPMPFDNGNVQTSCTTAPNGFEDQRTYVNGVFVNKSYIMPINSDPANPIPSDVTAITAFQNAMPGYTIIPIDASLMFGTGGALHCITMQIPAENPIFIRHNAITGNQPLQSYVINAVIKNKSGLASQFVYYRKSTSPTWIAIPMTSTSINNYTATIPMTGLLVGDVIEYFIEATSNNGKTISKPLVAREGGFNRFTINSTLGLGGFDEETNFALGIYPNPSNGSFTLPISVDSFKKICIEIYDLLGRSVYYEYTEIDRGLHLKNIVLTNASGVYIVKTTIDGALAKTQRLIIK